MFFYYNFTLTVFQYGGNKYNLILKENLKIRGQFTCKKLAVIS